jgi:hypothetical protein
MREAGNGGFCQRNASAVKTGEYWLMLASRGARATIHRASCTRVRGPGFSSAF